MFPYRQTKKGFEEGLAELRQPGSRALGRWPRPRPRGLVDASAQDRLPREWLLIPRPWGLRLESADLTREVAWRGVRACVETTSFLVVVGAGPWGCLVIPKKGLDHADRTRLAEAMAEGASLKSALPPLEGPALEVSLLPQALPARRSVLQRAWRRLWSERKRPVRLTLSQGQVHVDEAGSRLSFPLTGFSGWAVSRLELVLPGQPRTLRFSLSKSRSKALGPLQEGLEHALGPPLPDLKGKYRYLSMLGRGSLGPVFLVEEAASPSRRWALKELREVRGARQAEVLRKTLENEQKRFAGLSHGCLVRLREVVAEQDTVLLFAEAVEGLDLNRVFQEAGRLSETCVAAVAEQVCGVLAYLHGRQPEPIVLRDLKPSNLMLTANGKVRLIDFGVARVREERRPGVAPDGAAARTADGSDSRIAARTPLTVCVGTRGYAAPEQYPGSVTTADRRADVYALGAIMFELLTGERPANLGLPLPPAGSLNPRVHPDLAAIVGRACDPIREERYSSIDDLERALLAFREQSLGISAPDAIRELQAVYRAAAARAGAAAPVNWENLSGSRGIPASLVVALRAEVRAQVREALGGTGARDGWEGPDLEAVDLPPRLREALKEEIQDQVRGQRSESRALPGVPPRLADALRDEIRTALARAREGRERTR